WLTDRRGASERSEASHANGARVWGSPRGEARRMRTMIVFLVPVAADRYELYCEQPDESAMVEDSPRPARGVFRRMADRFHAMVAEAEHERRRGPDPATRRSLAGRVKARVMRWIAESIAEQRLLWQLRGQTAATLVHPD